MFTALLVLSTLSQAPTPPSAAEWAARADKKLLSFVMEPMPVVRSKERRMEIGGLFSFSDELAAVLAEVPEAAITFQGAQRSLQTATFLGLGGVGAGLVSVGLLVGALVAAGQTAIIVLAVSSGVVFLVAATLAIAAATFAQNASRGLLLALEQYNHALLAAPAPASPPSVDAGGRLEGGLVLRQF
jgi:hypothetical protein